MEISENWNQQKHEAIGLVYFQVDKYGKAFLRGLKEYVQKAISESPSWKDVPSHWKGNRWGIGGGWISVHEEARGIERRPAPFATVVVRVHIIHLKPTQLCAFHNYMDALVRKLAAKKIEHVNQVYSDIIFRARGTAVHCYHDNEEFYREVNHSDSLTKIIRY